MRRFKSMPSPNVWLLATILILLLFLLPSNSSILCGSNEVPFMNKCFCDVGYDRDATTKLCTVPILSIGGCDCNEIHQLGLLKIWNRTQSDYRCECLCRSNSEIGVPYSSPAEWYDNQNWLQIGFYRKELPQKRRNWLTARLDEFAEGFNWFQYLDGVHLGHVIEFGAGPYTQLRNLMERVHVGVKSVVLVDPMLHEYETISRCTYASGRFEVNETFYNTTLVNSTVESFKNYHNGRLYHHYDTLIVMNVLVYAQNGFTFLETLYDLIKPGGLLIFHDRWFDNIAVSSTCKPSDFYRDLIQLKRPVFEHFLSHFLLQPYFNTNQTDLQIMRSNQWCYGKDNEQGYFVVARKKLVQ